MKLLVEDSIQVILFAGEGFFLGKSIALSVAIAYLIKAYYAFYLHCKQ